MNKINYACSSICFSVEITSAYSFVFVVVVVVTLDHSRQLANQLWQKIKNRSRTDM